MNVELNPVRVLLVSCALLMPLAASAQKPSDWRKTGMKPVDFAKRIDSAIFNLKGALGEGTFHAIMFDGGSGRAKFKNRIRDRKNYRVEFVRLDPKAKNIFSGQIVYSRNGIASLVTAGENPRPLAPGKPLGFVPNALSPVQAFPQYFQQLFFEPYVSGRSNFGPFVQGLLKGDGGYTVKMESRTMQGGGRVIPQVRLFATRTPSAAKKYGEATIEIVTDAGMFLPLQIRALMTDAKGRNARFEWQSMWSGPFRFDDKWFKVPAKQQAWRRLPVGRSRATRPLPASSSPWRAPPPSPASWVRPR